MSKTLFEKLNEEKVMASDLEKRLTVPFTPFEEFAGTFNDYFKDILNKLPHHMRSSSGSNIEAILMPICQEMYEHSRLTYFMSQRLDLIWDLFTNLIGRSPILNQEFKNVLLQLDEETRFSNGKPPGAMSRDEAPWRFR